MTAHHHDRQVCRCGAVIAQCRCMGPKTNRVVCETCPTCQRATTVVLAKDSTAAETATHAVGESSLTDPAPARAARQATPAAVGDVDEDAETLALRTLEGDAGEAADGPWGVAEHEACADREMAIYREHTAKLAEKDAEIARLRAALETPRAMVLHCPACGKQHLDQLEADGTDWAKRPHRKHLCKNTPAGPDTGCGHLWKPLETPTVGVLEVRRLPTSIGTGQRVDCSKCGHSGEVWIDPQPVIVGALQKAVAMALADEAMLTESLALLSMASGGALAREKGGYFKRSEKLMAALCDRLNLVADDDSETVDEKEPR